MGKFFKQKPVKDAPVSLKGIADGLARLEQAWERLEVVGGHVEWTPSGLPKIVCDVYSGNAAESRAWEIELNQETGVASFLNCFYKRGPVTVWLGDITGHSLTKGAGGVTFVSAKINTETGAAEIVSGAWASVSSSTVPTDEYIFLPLYKLLWETVNGVTYWTISVDMVSYDVGVYV